MLWLTNSTLCRLRDQLAQRGTRPSVLPAPDASPEDALMAAIEAEMGPLAEAMYIMMAADGSVGEEERDVLRGALRNLSDGTIRSAHIEALLANAADRVAHEGAKQRLAVVAGELCEDSERAEVAFVLASAIAFADNAIADEENEVLNDFAEHLGISEERANALLDTLEDDLRKEEAAKQPT